MGHKVKTQQSYGMKPMAAKREATRVKRSAFGKDDSGCEGASQKGPERMQGVSYETKARGRAKERSGRSVREAVSAAWPGCAQRPGCWACTGTRDSQLLLWAGSCDGLPAGTQAAELVLGPDDVICHISWPSEPRSPPCPHEVSG